MSAPIAILIVVILFLSFILPFILRRIYYKKLFSRLDQKRIDELNILLDSKLCKLLFRPFNREFFRLNGYLVKDDSKLIDKQFDFLINKMQLDKTQSTSVLNKAFNYYLSKKDRKHTRKILDEMKKNQFSESEINNNEMLYEIILERKSTYINELLRMINELSDASKNALNQKLSYRISVFHYLIGIQYSYLHDIVNMNKHFNLALKELEDTAFEEEMKKYKQED